jgi:ribosomal protein S18 acetylase RimI-like enzyme
MQTQPISQIAPFVADATSAHSAVASYADVASPRPFPSPWLLVRRLGQDDRAALAAHLIGLPEEDRRTRFGGNLGDAAIRRHCDDLDLDETVCFAALDATGEVIGAALGFIYGVGAGHHRPSVEIAVSVAPEYRRRGRGADLVARVCGAVAASGADAAVFEFDPSNIAIRSLVRHLGGRVAPHADSCVIPLSTLH